MPDPHWQAFGILLTYSAAVVLASVFGGLLPEWIRLTHTRMQLLISFVGGFMLGVAVFHMIPHALVNMGMQAIDRATWGIMLGLLATFLLLRFFHFHQHGPADFGVNAESHQESEEHTEAGEHTHLCSDHNHPHTHKSPRHTRWTGVLVGLGLHTLMDGVALAASVTADSSHGHWLAGFGTFLAIFLHKPLDAVSITSLMQNVGTANTRLLVNIGFALTCPLGAILFWTFAGGGGEMAMQIAGFGLAFSAGVFLCIALSDLLPEMEFHSHSRWQLSLALFAGILLAWLVGVFEGRHAHTGQPITPVPATAEQLK